MTRDYLNRIILWTLVSLDWCLLHVSTAPICESQIYAHPTDCTKFFTCFSSGSFYLMSCPDGLLFNPEISVCDWEENVDCETNENPASANDGRVPVNAPTIEPHRSIAEPGKTSNSTSVKLPIPGVDFKEIRYIFGITDDSRNNVGGTTQKQPKSEKTIPDTQKMFTFNPKDYQFYYPYFTGDFFTRSPTKSPEEYERGNADENLARPEGKKIDLGDSEGSGEDDDLASYMMV